MPEYATTSLLQTALQGTADADTPRQSARAVLRACQRRLGAHRGSIYLLDLQTGYYVPFVSWPEDSVADVRVRAEGIEIPDLHITTLDHFLAAASPPVEDEVDYEGVVIYSFRGKSCVGAIRLDGPSSSQIEPELREDLLASANLLVSVYEDEFAFNLLGQIQEPLAFDQGDEQFFSQIAALIALSSGMEFVALREHDEDRLSCLALDGFGENPKLSEWDLEPISDYPHFAEALAGETVSIEYIDTDPGSDHIRERSWSKEVRSYVTTPVRVGDGIFGVLSVASRCPFQYAPLEIRGFQSIANGVGVSITNFRNARQITGQVSQYTQAAVAITAVELARAARHEAVGHIDNSKVGLHRMWSKFGKYAKDAEPYLDAIDGELTKIGNALIKIQVATKAPKRQWTVLGVRQLWDEALTGVSARLDEQRVHVRYQGRDVNIYAAPDWLRQVFNNLLLNSIDAFRDTKKGGRQIDLIVETPAEKAKDFHITYRDNATGINPARLQVPDDLPEAPFEQQLFQPGVTSKDEGSGFGLWLVRNILDDHHGSIDLTDHRTGVTFVIQLPKAEEGKALMDSERHG